MRQLSQGALTALLGRAPSYARRLRLCRRRWNGAAYVYDPPVDFTRDAVECGRLNFKLDREGYGVWSYPNCVFTVRNERNQWHEGNPDGWFPPGTLAYLSRVTVEAGILGADGQPEFMPLFCGYLSEDTALFPSARTAQLTVLSPSQRLDAITAENVSAPVSGELLGSDSGAQFTTAGTGAGIIVSVLRGQTAAGPEGAQELLPSADYSVSQLNEYSLGARITLAQGLSQGQSLWINYRRWHRDVGIDWLLSAVLDAAGVAARGISPVSFANDVKNTFSQSDQTAFAAGTFDNCEWQTYLLAVALVNPTGFYHSPGSYISPPADGGAHLTRWGRFNAVCALPAGASASYCVRDSGDGADWSDWRAISPGDDINSARRYIQLKWDAATDDSWTAGATPQLASWSAEYYTSDIAIQLANLSGYSCLDAVKALAGLCAYETGFDSAETFIFRPRAASAGAAAELDGRCVISADSLSGGGDRVYSRVKVRYGNYERTADSLTENEPPPTALDRHGARVCSLDGGSLLPAGNVDVAWAAAPTIWAYTSKARRRFTVSCRFLGHLELGDVVNLTLENQQACPLWKWGGRDAVYGGAGLRWYDGAFAAARLWAFGTPCRVEGLEHDLENWRTALDLTEVI